MMIAINNIHIENQEYQDGCETGDIYLGTFHIGQFTEYMLDNFDTPQLSIELDDHFSIDRLDAIIRQIDFYRLKMTKNGSIPYTLDNLIRELLAIREACDTMETPPPDCCMCIVLLQGITVITTYEDKTVTEDELNDLYEALLTPGLQQVYSKEDWENSRKYSMTVKNSEIQYSIGSAIEPDAIIKR